MSLPHSSEITNDEGRWKSGNLFLNHTENIFSYIFPLRHADSYINGLPSSALGTIIW